MIIEIFLKKSKNNILKCININQSHLFIGSNKQKHQGLKET